MRTVRTRGVTNIATIGENTNNMTFRVIGDSHVVPEVWSIRGIDATSHPGLTFEAIIEMEAPFATGEHIVVIAGTNDNGTLEELREAHDALEINYLNTQFTFILPFYFKEIPVWSNVMSFDIPDQYFNDSAHLTCIGQLWFVRGIVTSLM
jgi:hypothetical protein